MTTFGAEWAAVRRDLGERGLMDRSGPPPASVRRPKPGPLAKLPARKKPKKYPTPEAARRALVRRIFANTRKLPWAVEADAIVKAMLAETPIQSMGDRLVQHLRLHPGLTTVEAACFLYGESANGNRNRARSLLLGLLEYGRVRRLDIQRWEAT